MAERLASSVGVGTEIKDEERFTEFLEKQIIKFVEERIVRVYFIINNPKQTSEVDHAVESLTYANDAKKNFLGE